MNHRSQTERAALLKNMARERANWCIVTADNNVTPNPVVGSREPHSNVAAFMPFQRAICRASLIACHSQILFTAPAASRAQWSPWVWSIRAERRFVSNHPYGPLLSSAAAILSVAENSPLNQITVLPSRCYVAHEDRLLWAIGRALRTLPEIPEGVVTLGMLDMEDGIDEDYLVVSRPRVGRGLQVDAFARRPVPWVARHLKQHGALVASGIMIGYAGTLAAHIVRQWPGLDKRLKHLVSTAAAAGKECEISSSLTCNISSAVVRSLRWHPPAFRQRVFGVSRCGWSGLKSPQSLEKTRGFLCNESPLVLESGTSSVPGDCTSESMSDKSGELPATFANDRLRE